MELQLVKKYDARAWDGVVVPLGEGNLNSYQGPWEQELAAVRASGRFEGKTGEIFRFSVLSEGVLTQIFLLGLGKDWSLEQVLESRRIYQYTGEGDVIPVSDSTDKLVATVAAPILSEGDLLGLVLFISPVPAVPTGDAEYKLAQTIAAFLGRHMEG